MSPEECKAICNRFVEEILNQGNLDVVEEIVASDFKLNKHEMGREGLKQAVTWWRSAFPDLKVTVEDTLIEGDSIGFWYSARGTHKGEFIGIPPTEKEVNWSGFDLLRIVDGRIAERRFIADRLGIVHQLGGSVVKNPPETN